MEDLLSVHGVGLYAAAAVSCFKYGAPVPIVDANVLRVFSRITGTAMGRDLRRSPSGWALARAVLPARTARQHNYGLLDFAAQVCTVARPKCDACDLARICAYGRRALSD
jgi:A/G-specific adenine glycosylase